MCLTCMPVHLLELSQCSRVASLEEDCVGEKDPFKPPEEERIDDDLDFEADKST